MNVNTAEDGQRVRMWRVQPEGQALVVPIPDGLDPTRALRSVERLLDKQPITRFPDYCPVGVTDKGQLVVRGLGHDTMDIQRFGGEIKRAWARSANWRRHRWIIGALAVGLLVFSIFQANAGEWPWGDWEYEEDALINSDTDDPLDAWTSIRATNQGYVLASHLVVRHYGVLCLLGYWPVIDDEEVEEGWLKYRESGPYQRVTQYESLPVAMRNCREAIDQKLEPTPQSPMASGAGRRE